MAARSCSTMCSLPGFTVSEGSSGCMSIFAARSSTQFDNVSTASCEAKSHFNIPARSSAVAGTVDVSLLVSSAIVSGKRGSILTGCLTGLMVSLRDARWPAIYADEVPQNLCQKPATDIKSAVASWRLGTNMTLPTPPLPTLEAPIA